MTTGYPWYWRAKNALPSGMKGSARRLVDSVAARAIGSANRGGSGVDRACLTLDDGPDPEVTPALLKELAARDVRCTFFLLTDQVLQYPELTREIVAGGHEVGLHGQDHRTVSGMSTVQAQRYLGEGRSILEDVTGRTVSLYRPPYGAQSLSSYLGARRAGLDVVVWSSDANDWVDRPAAEVVTDALVGADPGAIMLFHERLEAHPLRGAPTTGFDRVAVVAAILDGMRDRGLTPSTVGELGPLHRTAWFRP
jgi:peptidoglycan/xylan/chitin deacetylase (PgdA/CDA1 family)